MPMAMLLPNKVVFLWVESCLDTLRSGTRVSKCPGQLTSLPRFVQSDESDGDGDEDNDLVLPCARHGAE